MDKYLKYTLIVIMILSLLLNFFLFLVIGVQESEWEQQYYINGVEWCELVNDYTEITNSLITQLRYYDNAYFDIPLAEQTNCFEGGN